MTPDTMSRSAQAAMHHVPMVTRLLRSAKTWEMPLRRSLACQPSPDRSCPSSMTGSALQQWQAFGLRELLAQAVVVRRGQRLEGAVATLAPVNRSADFRGPEV